MAPAEGESCENLRRIILNEDLFSNIGVDRTEEYLKCVTLLAGKGSVWVGDPKSLNRERRVLAKKSAAHMALLAERLFDTGAADRELLWALVSTPKTCGRIKKDPLCSWYRLEEKLNPNLSPDF